LVGAIQALPGDGVMKKLHRSPFLQLLFRAISKAF